MKLDSLCVKGLDPLITTKSHQLPIYATSSFVFEDTQEGIDIFSGDKSGHVYSRYGNPTLDTVARKIAMLEGADLDREAHGLLTSSGMSAISTAIGAIVKSGDSIITQGDLYGGTTEMLNRLFKRFGVNIIYADLKNLAKIEDYLKSDKDINLIYLETPANPTLACVDLEAIGTLGQKYGVKTAIDNTFATPYLQRPLSLGIDVVVHSATKYLNGHGQSITGAIVTKDKELHHQMWETLKLMGGTCNPFDAWMINHGLKTLALRMDKHCINAQKIAEFLEQHNNVTKVNYIGLESHPDHALAKRQMSGFGGMLSFETKGDIEQTKQFLDRLNFCTQTPTLGDTDTLLLHPASSSHLNVSKDLRVQHGISDTLVRISVGIENVEDIMFDLDQALM